MCYYKIPPPKGESVAEAGMEAPGVEAGGAGRKKSKKQLTKRRKRGIIIRLPRRKRQMHFDK